MSGTLIDRTPTLTPAQKVGEAMRCGLRYMPADTARLVMQMLTPASIATIAATVAAWAVSQAFGIGEIVDAILLVAGVASLGLSVFSGGRELVAFMKGAVQARTHNDLDRAGQHFARAVAILGVSFVEAVLMKGRGRVIAERGRPTVKPRMEMDEPPVDGNKLRVKRVPKFEEGGKGRTDPYGTIEISRAYKLSDQRETLLHELVHRYLSPRVGPMRKLRAELRMSGAERSDLLLYLEEVLAEGYLRLKQHGLLDAITAVLYPIARVYVTVSRLCYEGHVVGTVMLAGSTFFVSITEAATPPSR